MIGLMSPSFAAAVAARAEARPDGEVVRLAGEPGWTAAALWERACAVAGGLAGIVGVGEAVATCLPAGPEAIAVTTALSALGAVELPLDPDIDVRWARTLARSAGCVTTVTTGDLLHDLPFLGQLGQHTTVPLIGGDVPLDELIASGRPMGLRRLGPGAPALVMTTSGTTGRVKGALLPVAAGPGQAARVQRAMRYSPTDVLYNFFPWHHINARHAAFLPAVVSGARLVIDRRFSASRFLRGCAGAADPGGRARQGGRQRVGRVAPEITVSAYAMVTGDICGTPGCPSRSARASRSGAGGPPVSSCSTSVPRICRNSSSRT